MLELQMWSWIQVTGGRSFVAFATKSRLRQLKAMAVGLSKVKIANATGASALTSLQIIPVRPWNADM